MRFSGILAKIRHDGSCGLYCIMGSLKVILLESGGRVGGVGAVVSVKRGFFRNYLYPKRKAVLATQENMHRLETEKKALVIADEKRRAEAEAIAERIRGVVLVMEREAGESEQLYGSVSTQDIAKLLGDKEGIVIRRHNVRMKAPIKTLGTYEVSVELHPEVVVNLTIDIVRHRA